MSHTARHAVRIAAATTARCAGRSSGYLSLTAPSLAAFRSQSSLCPSPHRSFVYWSWPSRVLLSPASPSPTASAAASPSDSASESSDSWWRPARRSLRTPRLPRTADFVSPSRRIMTYLEQHGPQTRRALYAIFGPTPAAPSAAAEPATAASPQSASPAPAAFSPENAAAAAVLSSSPIVTSQPVVLRSKRHLTVLLQQLTRSGRVLTKLQQQDGDSERRRAAAGKPGRGGSGAGSGLRVYEMRDYSKSSRKLQHLTKKDRKQPAATSAEAGAGKTGSRKQRRASQRGRAGAG